MIVVSPSDRMVNVHAQFCPRRWLSKEKVEGSEDGAMDCY